jgi:ribosome-associated heat shock protein Hsp15
MRLDKWLWCARFFKTRRLAADAIRSGRVRDGGQRVKVSRSIRPGDSISIRKGPYTWTVTIESLARNRLPAAEAVRLYSEHPDSIEARTQLALQLKSDLARTPRPPGRPDKRERRKLIRFTRRRE